MWNGSVQKTNRWYWVNLRKLHVNTVAVLLFGLQGSFKLIRLELVHKFVIIVFTKQFLHIVLFKVAKCFHAASDLFRSCNTVIMLMSCFFCQQLLSEGLKDSFFLCACLPDSHLSSLSKANQVLMTNFAFNAGGFCHFVFALRSADTASYFTLLCYTCSFGVVSSLRNICLANGS